MRIKIVKLTAFLLILTGGILSCERLNETPTANIQYISTELGGCNIKSEQKSGDDEMKSDTVIITVSDDSVRIFVGQRYICMSKSFETQCEIIDDVITIYIVDKCAEDPKCSYKRCICYYTFDFVFNYSGGLNQKYKILLISPQKEEPDVFAEGVIKNK